MSTDAITIQHGLPEAHRQQAGDLICGALFSTLLPRQAGPRLLARLLDSERAITAFYDGQFTGIAGLSYAGRGLFRWEFRVYREECGLLRGLIPAAVMFFYAWRQRRRPLVLGELAVEADFRSRGVGTCLLDAVCLLAREQGYDSVSLDVVDTNPRARALYERYGFVAAITHRLPGLRPFLGFGAYTTLIRQVPPPQGTGRSEDAHRRRA